MAHQQFTFPEATTASTFKGSVFYNEHKGDDFLESPDNVKKVLSMGGALRATMKNVAPGQAVQVGKLAIAHSEPLLCYKAPAVDTLYSVSRLQGMCAAYAYQNQNKVKDPVSAVGVSMGYRLVKDDKECVKAYLATVPGSEHFPDVFGYWSAVMAAIQVNRGILTEESCKRIAMAKNSKGERVADQITADVVEKVIKPTLSKMIGGPSAAAATMKNLAAMLKGIE